MEKFLWCVCWSYLVLMPAFGQRAIALLNSPVRELPATLLRTQEPTQLNFSVVRGMIYLNGEVEDESASFIFDTGAPTLVLNETVVPKEDQAFAAYSCAGPLKVGSRMVSTFSWANQTHHHLEALTVDMSHLGEAGQQPRGLIGYELFKNQVLCLDYAAQHLTLLDSRQWRRMRKLSEPLARFPIEMYDHLPVIKLEHAGQTLYFGIDTGAAANLLSPAVLRVFNHEQSVRPREELQGLDQEVKIVEAVNLNDLWVGQPSPHRFLLTDLDALTAGSKWSLDGLLGYEFLARYRVVIDYPRGELSVWPL